MDDIFIAKKCNFQGEHGFMVSQIHKGEKIAQQFVSESAYKDFCDAIGIIPELKA